MAYPLAEQKALQRSKDSKIESSGTAHDRINSLMSLTKFLDQFNIPGDKTYSTIMEEWQKGGMPYTVGYSDLDALVEGKIARGHTPRRGAYHKQSDYFPEKPDTIFAVDMGDWIAELAHAQRFNAPQSVRDSLNEASQRQRQFFGTDVYGFTDEFDNKYFPIEGWEKVTDKERLKALGLPKAVQATVMKQINRLYKEGEGQDVPVEFEAHEIIEPKIQKKIDEAMAIDRLINDFRDIGYKNTKKASGSKQ